jgi:hypothetical protein
MSKENTIYDLDLHEVFFLGSVIKILRVPGGWIYKDNEGSVFVPLHYEFQPKQTPPPIIRKEIKK